MKPSYLSIFTTIVAILALVHGDNERRDNTKRVMVMGSVFCDSCLQNTFSKHSYFLQGVAVHVECKLTAGIESERNFTFAATRKTDKFGVYRFVFPSADGRECRNTRKVESFCKATLKKSPSTCNLHGLNRTREMYIRARQGNSCIFSMRPMSCRPPLIDSSICRNERLGSVNNSDIIWPPLQNPWFPLPFPSLPPMPHLPHLPFLPPLPHLPPLPFPKSPPFPFPFPFNHSLPMPSWPHLPPIPSIFPPPKSKPDPPFALGDPTSWYPYWRPPSPPPSQNQSNGRSPP
ncbi:hypothetical protein EJ110_NYTH22884 [Nymphaea thermarum]|nr:hypothetical protein EJ110_NYTH22884 [Nymphaea thermarum]